MKVSKDTLLSFIPAVLGMGSLQHMPIIMSVMLYMRPLSRVNY